MMDDAEQRVALVNRINGALFTLRTAEERVRTAERALTEVRNEQIAERKAYAEMQTRMTRLLDDVSEKAGVERNALILKINDSLANLDALKKRENNAKSEAGTATREREKEQKTLTELRTSLKKVMPAPESPEPEPEGVAVG